MTEQVTRERIRQLRIERNLSQVHIATRIGKSHQWVQKWEAGDIEADLSDSTMRQYLDVLNVDAGNLYLAYEDPNLTVRIRPASYEPRYSGEEGVLKAKLSQRQPKKLTNRHISTKSGYFLTSYLLRIKPGILTESHLHPPSLENGILLDGQLRLHAGIRDDGQLASRSFPFVQNLNPGDSYTLNSAIRHFTENTAKDMDALLLVIRVEISPLYLVRPTERMWTVSPLDYPPRELLSEISSKTVRVLMGRVDPSPHTQVIPHRHPWHEELIIVTEGSLEVITYSPNGPDELLQTSQPPSRINKPIRLPAYSAIHLDGRIWHSLRNPSDNVARYIVAHCIDLDDIDDTTIFYQRGR